MLDVLLCPFDELNLKKSGASKAPAAVKEELEDFFISESGKELDFNFEKLDLNDELESNYQKIQDVAASFQAAVGGDHSLTFPLLKALGKEEDIGLVFLDAHPDCQTGFYPPTYEDIARVMIKRNVISENRIVMGGLRNWSRSEYEFLKEHDISYFSMKEIREEGFEEFVESLMYNAKDWGSVYLSVDIDVVDPAFAPGTSWIEPGGLTSRQLIHLVQKLKNLNLRFTDIMEINPDLDFNRKTVRLGAKLLTCL